MAAKPVVVSVVALVMVAAMLLVCAPRDAAADSSGLIKYLGCFQKLADSSGACGKRKSEFSALEQAFGVDHKHKSDREKKGLCCKFSSYVDCYMKNVRHSCGDSAGKYALKFIESSTQKHVRNTCHKFDNRKCSSAFSASPSSLVVLGVSSAVLVFSLLL